MRIKLPVLQNILIILMLFTVMLSPETLLAQRKKQSTKDSVAENNTGYFSENYLRAENYIYKPNIKSVLFHRDGFVLSAPIINLNTTERLVLTFDDMEAETKRIKYTLIHCDAMWKPSDLMQNEYLNPYYEDDILDYKFSFNTLQKYIHYSLTFPTERMQPLLSGNYLLKVYIEDEPENILITRRFMIADEKVRIFAKVNQATVVEYRNYKQEIDFSINKTSYSISNPYKDLKVIIQQNGRWDNAITNLQPLYVKGDNLDYNYEDQNVFWGGNIFREFDIKGMHYYTEFIGTRTREADGYHVFLKADERKTFKVFIAREDLNGRMFIKSDDNINDTDTESEYVYMHFFLKYDAPMANGDIYILGELTDWRYSDENKMKYNYQHKGYEATLYLKQGYYNYQYAYLENGTTVGDETLIEGSHYETDNEYTIYVYNREQGKTYDVLVGLKQLSTFSK